LSASKKLGLKTREILEQTASFVKIASQLPRGLRRKRILSIFAAETSLRVRFLMFVEQLPVFIVETERQGGGAVLGLRQGFDE